MKQRKQNASYKHQEGRWKLSLGSKFTARRDQVNCSALVRIWRAYPQRSPFGFATSISTIVNKGALAPEIFFEFCFGRWKLCRGQQIAAKFGRHQNWKKYHLQAMYSRKNNCLTHKEQVKQRKPNASHKKHNFYMFCRQQHKEGFTLITECKWNKESKLISCRQCGRISKNEKTLWVERKVKLSKHSVRQDCLGVC